MIDDTELIVGLNAVGCVKTAARYVPADPTANKWRAEIVANKGMYTVERMTAREARQRCFLEAKCEHG